MGQDRSPWSALKICQDEGISEGFLFILVLGGNIDVPELIGYVKEHLIEKLCLIFYYRCVIKEQNTFFSPTSKIGRLHHIKKVWPL